MYFKNFKKIICKIGAFFCGLALTGSLSVSVFAWGTYTHKAITEAACKNCRFVINNKKSLLKGSILPDYDEAGTRSEKVSSFLSFFSKEKFNVYLYENHFFDPDSKRAGDALWYMHYHYQKAVELKSIEKLGRALHYLQDMLCPSHLFGYAIKENIDFDLVKCGINPKCLMNSTTHGQYENLVDNLVDKHFFEYVTFKTGQTSVKLSKYVKNKSYSDALNIAYTASYNLICNFCIATM